MGVKFIIISLIISPLSLNAFSKELKPSYLPDIPVNLERSIKLVSDRQSGGTQRPQACPLESKNHLNLLNKVLNIKGLFNENCLDNNQTIIDEVLEGAESIQEELNKIRQTEEQEPQEQTEITESIEIGGVSIDGKAVSNVLSNINNIYTRNSCKNLSQNKSFLSTTAEIILDISKIGLIVPNTTVLAVAGGGIALSSTLEILNSILSKRFDFEETEDRQTFIKLNCAFYDIRRDIEKSGFLDVSTEDHENDLLIVDQLSKEIQQEHKMFQKAYQNLTKDYEGAKKEFYQNESGHLFELIDDLTKITIQINTPINIPSQKLALIELLARSHNEIKQRLNTYITYSDDELNFLNYQLLGLIEKFNPQNIEQLIELQGSDLQEFSFNIQEPLKYHINRLNETYQKMLSIIDKKWSKTPYEDRDTPEKYLTALKQERAQKSEKIEALYLSLKNVHDRLKRIIDEVPFTSSDDGTENVVSILSEFDSIVDQIYGKHGEKFLEYATKKSLKLNKEFIKNFDDFSKNYLTKLPEDNYTLKPITDISQLNLMYACQDARPFRRHWKLAESLAQQGYDFVATNADLFHSDIDRVFLGRTGNRSFGFHRILSKYEKIQMHHKSAIYAKKKITGINFDKKYHKKYLKKKFLGKAILQITESKKKAMKLQELIEVYDCPSRTIMP